MNESGIKHSISTAKALIERTAVELGTILIHADQLIKDNNSAAPSAEQLRNAQMEIAQLKVERDDLKERLDNQDHTIATLYKRCRELEDKLRKGKYVNTETERPKPAWYTSEIQSQTYARAVLDMNPERFPTSKIDGKTHVMWDGMIMPLHHFARKWWRTYGQG